MHSRDNIGCHATILRPLQGRIRCGERDVWGTQNGLEDISGAVDDRAGFITNGTDYALGVLSIRQH